jgi:hypothetical protein
MIRLFLQALSALQAATRAARLASITSSGGCPPINDPRAALV